MLEVDFHCHTLFSRCGLHTIVECLSYARDKGMLGLAITDHGRELKGHIPSTFWDRLTDPVPGIRLLKGIECNIRGDQGEIDFPLEFLLHADVVLLGLHVNLPKDLGVEGCTTLLLKALEENPYVDIITHPNDQVYPVDFESVTRFAASHGIALELNNSKNLYSKVSSRGTIEMLEACKRNKCLIAVNSDAHALHEIGLDDAAKVFLQQVRFPHEYIVNRDAASAFGFVENRRLKKQEYSLTIKKDQ
jgi:putative hydrolase